MEILTALTLFFAGLVCIIRGGDWFVDASLALAKRSRLPTVLVGATLVSLATTLPEMLVSLTATMRGAADVAVGNAIGSVSCNTGFILGGCLLFSGKVQRREEFGSKGAMLLLAVLLLGGCALNRRLTVLEGCALLSMMMAFLFLSTQQGRAPAEPTGQKLPLRPMLWRFALGTVALLVGARLLVDNGVWLARLAGVPERVIALTLIAIGTSLPELATAVSALVKKQGALSIGNLLGANMLNVTLVLPLCTMAAGGILPVDAHTVWLDLPAICAFLAAAFVPLWWRGRFYRWQGALLLGLYGTYVGALIRWM